MSEIHGLRDLMGFRIYIEPQGLHTTRAVSLPAGASLWGTVAALQPTGNVLQPTEGCFIAYRGFIIANRAGVSEATDVLLMHQGCIIAYTGYMR